MPSHVASSEYVTLPSAQRMFERPTVAVRGSRSPSGVKATVPVSPSNVKLPSTSCLYSCVVKPEGSKPVGAISHAAKPMAATASYSNAPMSRTLLMISASKLVKKSCV